MHGTTPRRNHRLLSTKAPVPETCLNNSMNIICSTSAKMKTTGKQYDKVPEDQYYHRPCLWELHARPSSQLLENNTWSSSCWARGDCFEPRPIGSPCSAGGVHI